MSQPATLAASPPVAAAVTASPVVRGGALTLALLCVGHFFIDLYSSALGVFQPVLAARMGLTLTQAGLLGGALLFSSSVVQPAYGYWSDRYPTRLFTVLAPAVAGLFIAALGHANSFGALLALVVLGGAGIASFHPQATANATAGLRRTATRARWMAVFISSGTLGMAVGPSFFSWLLGRVGPEQALWGAVPGVLMSLVLWLLLPAFPGRATRDAFDWRPFRRVLRPLTVHYLLVVIRSIVQITFTQLLPLYLTRARGMSLPQASLALTLYLSAGAVGGFVGGHLADRYGGRAVVALSMAGCVPFLALFFLTDGAWSLAGLALGGLTLLFTIPVNVVMAQALVPSQAGTVSALMMGFAWGIAGLVFIPLTGWVADRVGLHAALFSLVAFPVLGFLLTFLLPADRPSCLPAAPSAS